ncbi:MAG: response regulator [Burkholderiales bacterium]|nr:response regulator [Burkholderiales bacterium]
MDTMREKSLVRVIDDDPAMRKSWLFLLNGEKWPARAYDNPLSFLQLDDPEIPGCIVLDVRMPQMSGIELQREMKLRKCNLPIVFVSAHGDIDMAVKAIKDGACDFLPKPVKAERLLKAIEKAVARDWKQRKEIEEEREVRSAFNRLTDREKVVAEKVGQGLLNKQIGAELNISEKTVQAHRGSICRKLKVRSAAEIATLFAKLAEMNQKEAEQNEEE